MTRYGDERIPEIAKMLTSTYTTTKRLVVATACLGLLSTAAPASSQTSTGTVPRVISFNGQVLATSGAPRTGNVLLTFGLYEDQTGGTPLWTEQQAVSLDSQGRYAVVLGSMTQGGLPSDAFVSSQARWLGVAVDAGQEQPRFMLVSTSYALKAADADTIGGKAPTDFVLATSLKDDVKTAMRETTTTADVGIESTANALPKYADAMGTLTDSLVTEAGGNIGIATTAPQAKLELKGASDQNLFVLYNGANDFRIGYLANDTKFRIQDGTVDRLTFDTVGNVGIGTSSPAARLQVSGNLAVDSNLGVGTASPQAKVELKGASDQNLFVLYNGANDFRIGYLANDSKFRVQDGTVDRIVIDNSGNVGIGTASPTSKLHVAGDAVIDGNIGAKYQDVAEWVEASGNVDAGTVVIVDPKHPNRVMPAPKAYDSRVAGAVSRQPGLVLGEKSDGKAMVAQSGRVRIKADARYGAIKIGDLLVTSPTPGYAMKSRPIQVAGQTMHRPGTLLGKALEPLPNGKGEILVLLTLQ